MENINLQDFLAFFLASIRIIAMIISSPIFSHRQVPIPFKIGFSMIFGMLVSPTVLKLGFVFPDNNFTLILFVFKEILLGVSIGTIATFIFNIFRTGAHFMDFSIGFSMSQYYDPGTSSSATVLERFFNWIAIVVFLTFNFHHTIILSMIKSFEVVPLGNFSINDNIFYSMLSAFASMFFIAIQIAAPIIIVLFITDFTLGLISRTVPQFQVFILGMPIKILFGLLALSIIMPGLVQVFSNALDKISPSILNILSFVPVIFLGTDDKTEEPTSKKLQDARKKGQIAKSNDLNSGIILLGITLFFIFFGEKIYIYGVEGIIESLSHLYKEEISFDNSREIFLNYLKKAIFIILPIAGTAMILGIISNLMQVGFLTSGEGLKPDFKKLNPINGIKKFFSRRTLMELIKSLLKIFLVGFVGYTFVKGKIYDIMKVADLHPNGIYPFVKSLTDSQLIRVVMLMLLIGIVDFIFQKRQHKRDLKMTKQEIKEEYKQSEGDPQLKAKIKQKQREIAMSRMIHEVPKATVVVTNPTHYAVALKYEKGDSAPKILAKGVDNVAFRIRDIAKKNDIPVVENKLLARKLYSDVDLGRNIPQELYGAVAEVIAYVYSIKKR